jgi:putative nucleotidyltransferase with HDIG domain
VAPFSLARPTALSPVGRRLWRWFLAPSPRLTEPDQRRQAMLLSGLLLGLIVLAMVMETATTLLIDWSTYTGYRQTIVTVGCLLIAYAISRTHRLELAATLAVIIALVAIFVTGWAEPRGVAGGLLDYLILPLWIGSLFLDLKTLPLLIACALAGLLTFPLTTPAVTFNAILVGPFTFMVTTSILLLIVTAHRNRLEQDRRTATGAEVAQAYDLTIEGWSHALDLRDHETEGHTQRVTEMTVHLARTLGVDEEALVHIRRGALLHDIGKMGIPDEILLKPGKLTAEEWAIMQQHPVYAYDFLAPIAYLRPALDIPYCHHEKWDGTGYPRRLQGEQIPYAARLFALVDVWDALCSDRPYRCGWPREEVCAYIRAGAGSHFDPRLVDPFLRLVDEQALYD